MLILVIDLLTEQLPAVSLVFDPQERTIMQEPPRNLQQERMIDASLILYSYVLVALLESLACVGAFFLYLAAKGFPISTLLYNRAFWAAPPTPAAQAALAGGISAYFFTLVMCQAGIHIFSAKTLRLSLCEYPWWGNSMTNLGVLVAGGVAVLVIYPLQGTLFGTGAMDFWPSWVLFLAFGLVFIPVMEGFKYCARRGWIKFP